jgi:hypothetical protein
VRFTRWLPVAALALLLVGSSPALAESEKKSKKEDSSFGALKSAEAAEAQKQAAAWLKDVKNDDATRAKFEKIWEGDRPVIEKVASTLALGDEEAAKVLAEARDADAAAPVEVPSAIKDAKRPAFYRNNLGLAYARALTLRKVYEEALDAFAAVKAEDVVDPSAYLFHKAVCEYELMLKDKADDSIRRLIVDVSDSPERYTRVAALMAYDMDTWQEKDLGWIARKMDNIQRRLDLKRGGKQTQKMQKEVLVRLDEMIKELENQQKQQGQCPNGGSCPNGGQNPGNSPGTERSSAPQNDTNGGTANKPGEVDQKKVKEVAELWGKLPEKERAKALVELTRGMPAKDRAVIEAYFKELAKKTK